MTPTKSVFNTFFLKSYISLYLFISLSLYLFISLFFIYFSDSKNRIFLPFVNRQALIALFMSLAIQTSLSF